MVSELGARAPVPASAGSFAQTLAAQGNSQEALAAGTGPFPPSPAPSSAATTTAATPAALASSALASTALATSGLPALDTTSYGDDAEGSISAATLPGSGLSTATSALSGLPATAAAPAQGAGLRALAAAQSALGITESPAGSNDGPGLAIFRSAVPGSQAGDPWCATFASWAARQAGAPVGDTGQGSASVEGIADWAGRTGRLQPAGTTPAAGDLVLFGGRHIGIVEAVNADGTLTTVEGNYRNSVQRVRRSPLEATGYVRLG